MNRPLRDEDVETAAAVEPPKVFVRALSTPPAPPWEQARVARLDARLGAPLPLAELMHQVRRLDRWRPGQPGRFGAFYVRAREFRQPFETDVEVDGRLVTVRFGSATPDLGRLRGVGSTLLALMLCGVVLGTGVALALGARREATAQLEMNEQLVAARLKMAEAFRHRSNQARDLRVLVGHARPLGEVVGDLTWVATSKAPEARVLGVHWERGLLAIEARGDQPPFLAVDRPIERAEKPLRAGVWLWAVGRPQSLTTSSRGPISAELER